MAPSNSGPRPVLTVVGLNALPDDLLADAGRNAVLFARVGQVLNLQERDSRSHSVALLQELVEENDDQASNDQLHDEQNADAETEIRWRGHRGQGKHVDAC